MLQTTKENFDKLESRLLSINSNVYNVNTMREMIYDLIVSRKPTLIMATGGSKVVAYYLQLVLENFLDFSSTCEVIEPRDFFCKSNRCNYSNLVVISASGNTNGVKEALDEFEGKKYLVCENKQDGNYEVVSWGNETYDREHSFISLASSLGPISMLTSIATCLGGFRMDIVDFQIKEVNEAINLIANLLANYSNVVLPIALVNVLNGFQGGFVFILGVIGTIFVPKYIKEDLRRNVAIQKTVCILLSIVGLIILVY